MEEFVCFIAFCAFMYGAWLVIGIFPWATITLAFLGICFATKGITDRWQGTEYWTPPVIIISLISILVAAMRLIWFPA
jgi:hypothetical protein